MHIWYIHGAGATDRSFAWLQKQLPDHTANFLLYNLNESVNSVVNRLIPQLTEDSIIIGHSLGGIVGVLCSDVPAVKKLVTICTPFGGVRHADLMALFSFEPLFHDLQSYGTVMRKVHAKQITKPHLAIVGTSGLPFLTEPNDGAVTVASQTALPRTHYETLPLNHFEVLLSDEVAKRISKFIQE